MGKTRHGWRSGTASRLALGLFLASCAEQADTPPPPPETLTPVQTTPLPPTFEPLSTASYVAKVKNLITGGVPTDAEIAAVKNDASVLSGLIDGWIATPEFRARMALFFINAFQQGQITQASLFDQFGELPVTSKLFNNIVASFPLTVLQLAMDEGRPFTDAITTDTYLLTPPLASFLAYLDNRNISDTLRTTDRILTQNKDFAFTVSHTSGPIALADTLTPGGPNFMHWYLPTAMTAPCVDPQVIKGDTPRLFLYLFGSLYASSGCSLTISTPAQFADSEYDAWRKVKIRQPVGSENAALFYDVQAMRTVDELVLRIPRVGFFGTPAFFANWSTNASNQARVTMNQTLIVALGRSFDDTNNTVPLSSPALDAQHANDPACYACHKTLDPMRQIFRQAYTLSYHEQIDPAQLALPGVFAVDGITKNIANPRELAAALASHPRFPIAWTQKLCYWANSTACSENDPEFLRVANVFAQSGYNWKALVRELLSSPLVTGAKNTQTFADQGLTISVTRREQLCTALSARLGITDICSLGRGPSLLPLLPSDGYARGSTAPVLATDPSLFYRAATEQLCRVFADYVVDTTVQGKPSRYSSKTPDAAITDMVQTVMGLAPSDPRNGTLRQILADHFSKASKTMGIVATDALKSTFVLACTSPTSVSIGL